MKSVLLKQVNKFYKQSYCFSNFSMFLKAFEIKENQILVNKNNNFNKYSYYQLQKSFQKIDNFFPLKSLFNKVAFSQTFNLQQRWKKGIFSSVYTIAI